MYKDCDGNFAEVYHRDGETIISLTDLDADDLDVIGDLEFCDPSKEAVEHLLALGFEEDNLPSDKFTK